MDLAAGRLALVDSVTAALGEEIARHDPDAAIGWPELPTVRAMAAHVGFVHRWATRVVETGGPVRDADVPVEPGADLREWYEQGRTALLAALEAAEPQRPCWVIGVDHAGTAGFWRRRMLFESTKHLIDLRAAGGGTWRPAAELGAADYTDGVDELLQVFLPRSRRRLAPLPAAIALETTDTGHAWRIGADWVVGAGPDSAARISAPAALLALAVWDRADPRTDPSRFRIDGDPAVASAFVDTVMHPW